MLQTEIKTIQELLLFFQEEYYRRLSLPENEGIRTTYSTHSWYIEEINKEYLSSLKELQESKVIKDKLDYINAYLELMFCITGLANHKKTQTRKDKLRSIFSKTYKEGERIRAMR